MGDPHLSLSLSSMRTPLLFAFVPLAFAGPNAQNRWGFGLFESLFDGSADSPTTATTETTTTTKSGIFGLGFLPNNGGLLGFGLFNGNSESSDDTTTGQLCSRSDVRQGQLDRVECPGSGSEPPKDEMTEAKACPSTKCKSKDELKQGGCDWLERERGKGVFDEHFKPLLPPKEKYVCIKEDENGKKTPGFCCPAEKEDNGKERECLQDETIDSEVRHSQCNVDADAEAEIPAQLGRCVKNDKEIFGECISGFNARVKCHAGAPCTSRDQAKCVERVKCVACTQNDDCNSFEGRCVDGRCVECTANAHCVGANQICSVGECGTKMVCQGYVYKGSNGTRNVAPGVKIIFPHLGGRYNEAGLHLRSVHPDAAPGTRPGSLKYPHDSPIIRTDEAKTKEWAKLISQCKKVVDSETSKYEWKWAGEGGSRTTFFYQDRQVTAAFKGSVPAP